MFGFLHAATTLQRARSLGVKVAPFSPGERGRGGGRVGFKMINLIRHKIRGLPVAGYATAVFSVIGVSTLLPS